MDTDAVTQAGIAEIDAQSAHIDGATASGEANLDEAGNVIAWTFLLQVPDLDPVDVEGAETSTEPRFKGASRQYVVTEDNPTPPEGYLTVMVQEMVQSLS